MSTIIYLVVLLVGTLMGILFLETRTKYQPPKPTTQHTVTTTCQPGSTTLLMERNGEVVAVLVLRQINWSFNGPTTAEFTDLTYYMRDRSLI